MINYFILVILITIFVLILINIIYYKNKEFYNVLYFNKIHNNNSSNINDGNDFVANIYENTSPFFNENSIDGKLIVSGYNLCFKNCSGNCIEYGQTGDAICYPELDK